MTALGVVWAVGGRALALKLFPGALMLIILVPVVGPIAWLARRPNERPKSTRKAFAI